jgi:hypothetical protein
MNMLKRTIGKIIMTSAMLFCALPVVAQDEAFNAYSPYTMFGIGDISKQGTAYNKTMGGVGIASRDKRYINYLNPAAVTAREPKSFMADFGLVQGNRFYAQNDLKSVNNTFNIYDFVISFPVWKSLAMYAGFTPFSDLGYEITSEVTDPGIIGVTGSIVRTSNGYGGLSNVFIGGGMDVFKGLTLGVEIQHVFGGIHKEFSQVFSNTSYRSIYSGYEMNLRANSAKIGVQYEFPLFKDVSATFGATYKFAANIKGTVKDYEYGLISSVADSSRNVVTDLGKNKGIVKIANEVGVGFSLKGNDKWTAEINYINSNWSSCGMDKVDGFASVGNAVFSASSSQSVRAGFSIVPNRNDIRYYYKRITYRGGAYWDQAYCMLDGNSINAFGLTFGATLPVFSLGNGLTLGMDVGQRGSKSGNLIRERYVNFHIGVNLFDIWFLKPKYD